MKRTVGSDEPLIMEPFIWTSPDDTRALWQRFMRDGVCWVRMSGATELAQREPGRLVESLIGWTPLATHVNQVRVVPARGPGIRPYAVTNDEARFHIDQHPLLPPQLQILVCARQAEDPGGASMFIDTWKLLDELAAAGSPLLSRLFETQRVIKFHNFVWCAPTFSLRAANLVCVHNGFPRETDQVGIAFQRLLERVEPIRFKMETGDLLVSNNHRTLHARSAFTDTNRHLVRILAWLSRPLAAPEPYLVRARDIAMRTEQHVRTRPLWIRKRLGFSGLVPGYDQYDRDDLLAHYRGELAETTAQEVELISACMRVERQAS